MGSVWSARRRAPAWCSEEPPRGAAGCPRRQRRRAGSDPGAGAVRGKARRPSPSGFFFSSRGRHTRCSRDWSSDVCSSDLDAPRQSGDFSPSYTTTGNVITRLGCHHPTQTSSLQPDQTLAISPPPPPSPPTPLPSPPPPTPPPPPPTSPPPPRTSTADLHPPAPFSSARTPPCPPT